MMGRPAYQGPCAPPGAAHHYVFELYALDKKLDLPNGASRADIEKAMDGHVLERHDLCWAFQAISQRASDLRAFGGRTRLKSRACRRAKRRTTGSIATLLGGPW